MSDMPTKEQQAQYAEEAKRAREEAREALHKQFTGLCDELNAVAGTPSMYKVEEQGKWSFTIKRTGEGKAHTTIYSEQVYTERGNSAGVALRIRSSSYSKHAMRLKRGFDADGIAKVLHKRCTAILFAIHANQNRKAEAEQAQATCLERVKSDFGDIEVESGWSGLLGAEFTHGQVRTKTYDGVEYSASINLAGLTAEQVKELASLVNLVKAGSH